MPEIFGVVKLFEMAKLMYHEIIKQTLRKVDDIEIKIQIFFARTRTPSCFLPSYGYFSNGEFIK